MTAAPLAAGPGSGPASAHDPVLSAALGVGLDQLGLALDATQRARLLDYLALLQKWGAVYNLTAVRDPSEALTHHLLDSLAVVPALRRHTAGKPVRVMDVGAGAGLPGVVIAICCPEVQVDCVDAVAKKAAFIQQAAGQLGLRNLRGLHARVEKAAGPYDMITSRAFASLADFTAWSAQALAPDGTWMAMKGKRPDAEVAALNPQVAAVFHVEPITVPGLDAERCLVWMKPPVV